MTSEFDKADRAVTRAAVAIERAIATMLSTTDPLDTVARDYVAERLISELMERNPKAVDFLNTRGSASGLRGQGSMRLMNAIMDWRDRPADR